MYFVRRPTPDEAAQWREGLEKVLNNDCMCICSPILDLTFLTLTVQSAMVADPTLPQVTEQIFCLKMIMDHVAQLICCT